MFWSSRSLKKNKAFFYCLSRTLILLPNIALPVRTRFRSFRTNRYFIEKFLFFYFNGIMKTDGAFEYMEVNGASYRKRAKTTPFFQKYFQNITYICIIFLIHNGLFRTFPILFEPLAQHLGGEWTYCLAYTFLAWKPANHFGMDGPKYYSRELAV